MLIPDAIEQSHCTLKAYRGKPNIDSFAHMHSSIEVIYVVRGYMTELFSVQPYRLEAGQFGVFSALVPHRCMDRSEDACVYGLHIPMARFLKWGLPKNFVSRLTHGSVLIEDNPERKLLDETTFKLWMDDVETLDVNRIESLYAEVYGRLRRMATDMILDTGSHAGEEPRDLESFSLSEWNDSFSDQNETQWDKLEKMTMYIAAMYQEGVTATDVARHVNVHPNYASSLFHDAFAMTITEYITQRRLAYAFRALTETEGTVLDIALEAGFGSVRRFHHVFLAAYGRTPSSVRGLQRALN